MKVTQKRGITKRLRITPPQDSRPCDRIPSRAWSLRKDVGTEVRRHDIPRRRRSPALSDALRILRRVAPVECAMVREARASPKPPVPSREPMRAGCLDKSRFGSCGVYTPGASHRLGALPRGLFHNYRHGQFSSRRIESARRQVRPTQRDKTNGSRACLGVACAVAMARHHADRGVGVENH